MRGDNESVNESCQTREGRCVAGGGGRGGRKGVMLPPLLSFYGPSVIDGDRDGAATRVAQAEALPSEAHITLLVFCPKSLSLKAQLEPYKEKKAGGNNKSAEASAYIATGRQGPSSSPAVDRLQAPARLTPCALARAWLATPASCLSAPPGARGRVPRQSGTPAHVGCGSAGLPYLSILEQLQETSCFSLTR
jgi:hypothetical protein